MKKILLVLMSVAIGCSLFAQRTDLRNTRSQTLRKDWSEKQRVMALPAAEQMTWTEIDLPYSEIVTYDEENGVFIDTYYLTRGFYFTLTEASAVVINGPQGLAYYQIYTERTMENPPVATGYAIYKTLEAGTYYIVSDDNGALYFEDYDGDPLSTRMEVYVTNGTYSSYTDLPYDQLLTTTAVEGQLQDTLLLFPTTINIVNSTLNPHYINVDDSKSYLITCTFNSSTQEAYTGGVYFFNEILNGEIENDLLGSFFLAEETTNSGIYTATYTGKVNILPFAFTGGVSYQLSVEQLQTYTVPAALDAATTITNFPYSQTGNIEDGTLINCQDASLIGIQELPNELYYGHLFKVHLNEGDPLYITMNIDYFGVFDIGEIYLFEKSDNIYTKIGQIGFDEEEDPYLEFEAPDEMDLYILLSNTALMPFSSLVGTGISLPYSLLIENSKTGLSNINATDIKISNLATDFVTIKGAAGKNVVVYDIFGKCIWEQKIASDNEQIDVSRLLKGIYFVKLTCNGTNIRTVKLLKK